MNHPASTVVNMFKMWMKKRIHIPSVKIALEILLQNESYRRTLLDTGVDGQMCDIYAWLILTFAVYIC